jgi:hypothetical protein
MFAPSDVSCAADLAASSRPGTTPDDWAGRLSEPADLTSDRVLPNQRWGKRDARRMNLSRATV